MLQSPLPSVSLRRLPASAEARRPGLFPPALEPGGANAPFPGRPSPTASPSPSILGGSLLQDLPSRTSPRSFLSAPRHPVLVSELLSWVQHSQGWVSLAIPPPSSQTWVVAVPGRAPGAPALGPLGSHGTSWTLVLLSGERPAWSTPEASPSPPPSPPVPSTQLSRHYPAPPGPVTAWGSGDALGGGAHPSPLPPPALFQGQPPSPHGVTHGGEMAFSHPSLWHGGWRGSPWSPTTPCISV